MKPPKLTFLVTGLKIVFILFLTGFVCLGFVAMKTKRMADDVWKLLGITVPAAQKKINESFIYNHLYYSGATNAKNIAMGDRVAVVTQLVAYAKKYVSSPEFKKAYQEYQNGISEPFRRNLPAKPEQKMVESIRAEEKLLLEKRLAATEPNLNSPNPNVKKSAAIQVENIKKEMKALDDPDNPTIKRKLDMANRNYEYQLKLYNDAIRNFEAKYPSDPTPLLQQRLQQILNITADVDYAAQLKEGEKGLKFFINPAYEAKPLEWKLAFRAGKAATDAVRAAAQQWLKDLNIAAKPS